MPRPDRAQVQRYPARVIDDFMVSKERAALPCGCSILVGLRIDNREVATMAGPCNLNHAMLIERANQLLKESLAKPQHRLLVEVCAELLSRAATEVL